MVIMLFAIHGVIELLSSIRPFVKYCIFLLFYIILSPLIILTYSRGSYISIIITCIFLFLIIFLKKQSKIILFEANKINPILVLMLSILCFLVILLIFPSSCKRLFSIASFRDRSILHRLFLWRGGLILIAQYPLCGVGKCPGKIYTAIYQPYEINENYNGMINDILQIATIYGLPFLFVVILLWLTPLFLGLVLFRKYNVKSSIYFSGSLLSYIICSLFTTCYNQFLLIGIYCIISSIIIYHCIILYKKDILKIKDLRVYICVPIISSSICIMIFCLSLYFYNKCQFSIKPGPKECLTDSQFQIIPKNEFKNVILYFSNNPIEQMRSDILKMSCENNKILVFKTNGDIKSIDELKTKIHNINNNNDYYYVMAMDNTANAVLKTILTSSLKNKIKTIALSTLIQNHPYPELSIENLSYDGKLIVSSKGNNMSEFNSNTCKGLNNIIFVEPNLAPIKLYHILITNN